MGVMLVQALIPFCLRLLKKALVSPKFTVLAVNVR